ncbi:MAG: DMT family transporter [Candidatus Elarobacter sp.]
MNGRTLGVAAALFYIFLWASAYVPSKIGAVESSPLWFLVLRFAAAGLIALAIAIALGARLPRTRREWAWTLVLGALGNALYLGCTYIALQHMGSGVGAIVASTNPLLLALVAPALLAEPLTRNKIVGMLLGFGGVVAIVLVRAGSGTAEPADVALALFGVMGSVASTVVFKRFCAGMDLRAVTGLQLLAASIVLFPAALLLEGAPHASWSPELIASFAYCVAVMSIGASLLWFWLLTHGEASRVSAYYFLTPVFGLALAALLLHEPVGARDVGGLIAIAGGISLAQRA